MSDEKLKEEIKQVVTNLGNIEFTIEDELEFCKQVLKRKEQECEKLKNDKFALEVHINSLTSPVNVDDCEHSVYNGEYIACRYYEGQRCDELDFSNCMFRENVRLKQQLDQLKAENKTLKAEYTRVHTQLASQEAYILVDGEEVWSGSTRKLKQENEKLKAENEEVNKQLQSTKGLVTVGNKQLLDTINAYITVRTTLEDVKIMLQVVTETNNVYPLQTNLLLMLEKIREVIPDEKS